MDRTSAELIALADISIFRVETQSTAEDRKSLLKVQNFIRQRCPEYGYLEVGSHLGGSLLPYLLDDRCVSVISCDPRPVAMSDERGALEYVGNSTRRMISTLKAAGGSDIIAKLTTFELDISDIDPAQIGAPIHIAFIDAEHTNRAAFRDFLQAFKLVNRDALIVFHDLNILVDALCNVEAFLKFVNVKHHVFYLADHVFVVALGKLAEPAVSELGPAALNPQEFYVSAKQELTAEILANLSPELAEARQEAAKLGRLAGEQTQHIANLVHKLADARANVHRHRQRTAKIKGDLRRGRARAKRLKEEILALRHNRLLPKLRYRIITPFKRLFQGRTGSSEPQANRRA